MGRLAYFLTNFSLLLLTLVFFAESLRLIQGVEIVEIVAQIKVEFE